ncbi:hypothetical protein ACH5RR_029680 [Cinchona calisaya]|uniref:Uncharacterized protein n=1 Tax=Cinchona calisaya TaxID=153742 RepID=A0ABD2YVM4_9GENT
MEFLELVELAYGSREKYNHLKRVIKNIRMEFLTMDDNIENEVESDLPRIIATENDSLTNIPISKNVGLTRTLIRGNNDQVEPNVGFILQDPVHVISRGRPKSLRQKNPKECLPGKRRTCGSCQELGYNRNGCPTKKQKRHEETANLNVPINEIRVVPSSSSHAEVSLSIDFSSFSSFTSPQYQSSQSHTELLMGFRRNN